MKFEEAFHRLEEIVKELERSDISLDDALKLYEEGKRYATLCREKLGEAEEKIKRLVKAADGYREEDFEVSSGDKRVSGREEEAG